MTEPLRPYLTYSASLHAALLLLAVLFGRSQAARSNPVYTIDFVGPAAGVIAPAAAPAPAQAAPSQPAPAAAPEELTVPRRKRIKLSRPSLLSDAPRRAPPRPSLAPPPEAPPEAPAADTEAGAASASQAISGAPGSGGIVTDLPNFPYPWYISQVRAALWSRWSSRMPAEAGLATVSFAIMPNGSIVDLRVEESSGDPGFDLAAMGAAQDAAPFAPLPAGYGEPFLKVHVTLKSGT